MRKLAVLPLALGALMVTCANAAETPFAPQCVGTLSGGSAAINRSGEILVTWENEVEGVEAELCEPTIVNAAIGSTATGFTSLGAISAPSRLSSVGRVFLDDAGDGWAIGTHDVPVRGRRPGTMEYETRGAWYAFRPAGGAFRAPIELPTAGSVVLGVNLAGNGAGRMVLALSTVRGTYLATGSASGRISTPIFFGHGFQTRKVGVDERGRALIAGYYPDGPRSTTARAIALITLGAGGAFARPQVIAVRPVTRWWGAGYLDGPVMALGPKGNAVITWGSHLIASPNSSASTAPDSEMLIYRHADGRLARAVAFGDSVEGGTAVVDRYGRAIIIANRSGPQWKSMRKIVVAPSGRIVATQHLPEPGPGGDLAANVFGAWVSAKRVESPTLESLEPTPIRVLTGSIEGPTTTYTIPDSSSRGIGVTSVIDQKGNVTVIWVEGPWAGEDTLLASAITPGAKRVELARGVP